MARVHKLLGRANPAAATPATLYTAPALTKTQIYSLCICNTSTADDSVDVFLVPSGGAAGVSNQIINDMVIDFGDPFAWNVPQVLEAGDFIVVQSANGTCTFTASGVELTAPLGSQISKLLGRANPAAATPATLYTAPALTKTQVYSLCICNTSGLDDSVDVFLVPSGGGAGVSNQIISDMVVDFGDPYSMNVPQILETGDFIVVQSANGNCTFTASGLELT